MKSIKTFTFHALLLKELLKKTFYQTEEVKQERKTKLQQTEWQFLKRYVDTNEYDLIWKKGLCLSN
jgi:hypothetical protein